MSRIDELVERLCPDGVDFHRLGEIATLVRGHGLPKSEFVPEGVGAIHYGQMYTHFGAWADEVISHVRPDVAARLAVVNPGDVILANTSENLEGVCKAVAWVGRGDIVTGGHATVVKHSMEPKFLSYWFQSPGFQTQKRRLATGTKVIDVSARQLEGVKVPVPPLEIQREIVRILDQFTQLEAELEARRRQLAFCVEQFFDFGDLWADGTPVGAGTDVPFKRLGEVATLVRGHGLPKSDFVDEGVGAIHYGQIYTRLGPWTDKVLAHVTPANADKLARVETGDIIITNTSENLKDVGKAVAWLGGEPVVTGGHATVIKHDYNPKFLAFWFQSKDFEKQKRRLATGTKVIDVSAKQLENVLVPVLPLSKQTEIAERLDRMFLLTRDITVGLPAEIAARRKQYEYYRDKLLTFKEKA